MKLVACRNTAHYPVLHRDFQHWKPKTAFTRSATLLTGLAGCWFAIASLYFLFHQSHNCGIRAACLISSRQLLARLLLWCLFTTALPTCCTAYRSPAVALLAAFLDVSLACLFLPLLTIHFLLIRSAVYSTLLPQLHCFVASWLSLLCGSCFFPCAALPLRYSTANLFIMHVMLMGW